MKFVISSGTLSKHLQSISGVLATSNTIQILDNFLFEIAEKELTITASDLETTMTTKLTLEDVSEEGSVCLPSKMLMDILKNLPEQPITIAIEKDEQNGFMVDLIYDNGKSKMAGYDGKEYPKTKRFETNDKLVVAGEIIARGINKTIFAAGNDDLRPVMSGVFCQFTPNDLIFVATDAHKLVCYKNYGSKAEGTASFILPKKPLNIIKQNIRGDEEVSLRFNESNAIFEFGDIELICRLVEGKYPNYEAVIPKENPNVLSIDRLQLLSALKRVSIFSNKSTHQVKLKIAGQELWLSAEDIDYANESNERLSCSYDGDDMEIGFNSRFLLEMLSNLESKEIKIQMSAPNRAGILVPAEAEHENEEILMLVMPVTINR